MPRFSVYLVACSRERWLSQIKEPLIFYDFFYSGPASVEVANQSTQPIDNPTDVTEVVRTAWGRKTQSTEINEKSEEDNVISRQTITYISFGLTILLLALCFVLCFWWSHRKRKIRSFILVARAFYLDWSLTWITNWDYSVKNNCFYDNCRNSRALIC